MELISKKDLLCLEGVSCLAFNKDFSKCVLSKKDNNIYIYDCKNLAEAATWTLSNTLKAHLSYVSALDWHPVTNRIISSSHDRCIMIWNLEEKNKHLES